MVKLLRRSAGPYFLLPLLFLALSPLLHAEKEPDKDDKKIGVEKTGKGYALGGKGTDKSLAFLLEGGCESGECKFPEVVSAKDLAKSKEGQVFDAIHSYSYQHMSAVIAGRKGKNDPLTEDEQKLYAAHLILLFSKYDKTGGFFDRILKEPYRQMKKEGLIKEIPPWVESFSKDSDTILRPMLAKFDNDFKKFNAAISKMADKSGEISNDVSKDYFLAYLKDHPDVKKVFALVGSNHIDFLDKAGTVVKTTDKTRHLKVSVGDRVVEVQLFGGTHGDTAHFLDMQKAVEPGKKMADTPAPPAVKPKGDKPLTFDDRKCDPDPAYVFHETNSPLRDAEVATLSRSSAAFYELQKDIGVKFSPQSAPFCKLVKDPMGQWEKLIAVLRAAATPKALVIALADLRSLQSCAEPDALTVLRFPELARVDKFIEDQAQKFGNNKCVGYWRNQNLCVLHARGAVPDDFAKLAADTAGGEDCPKLDLTSLATKSKGKGRGTH